MPYSATTFTIAEPTIVAKYLYLDTFNPAASAVAGFSPTDLNPKPALVLTKNSDALRSILFVYSRNNPTLKYVQGMNEVLAPIYYVFAKDPEDGSLYSFIV